MPEIPALTASQARWCLAAVEAVVAADGRVEPTELQLLMQLGRSLGFESSLGVDTDTKSRLLESPPEMELETEQFVLRLAILAAYIDGVVAPEELETIEHLGTQMGLGEALLEVAFDEVKETILIATILGDLEAIILDSERGRNVIKGLGMTPESATAAIRAWRGKE